MLVTASLFFGAWHNMWNHAISRLSLKRCCFPLRHGTICNAPSLSMVCSDTRQKIPCGTGNVVHQFTQPCQLCVPKTVGIIFVMVHISMYKPHHRHSLMKDHPELTGGMIATSSPSCILGSLVASSGISTYSRFTVTRQLSSTLTFIPLYFWSSVSNSLDSGRGAGKLSEFFDVYELADAK